MNKASAATEVFAKRLHTARDLREISQAELASLTGLQPSAISHFETGGRKPSFENLKRLAEKLEVSTDYLLGRTELPEGESSPDDPLWRDYSKLSAADREHARELIELLTERAKKKRASYG